MKLGCTIGSICQEMSLSVLETFHQLCEIERTQILKSLVLAVLKIPYAGYLLLGKRSYFFDYDGNLLWYHTCTENVSSLYVFEDNNIMKESLYSTKKYVLLIHLKTHIFLGFIRI